jgi:hypothetical protein
MVEKKHELKETTWETLEQADARKIAMKEMKAGVVTEKVKSEARVEDARIMMMDHGTEKAKPCYVCGPW